MVKIIYDSGANITKIRFTVYLRTEQSHCTSNYYIILLSMNEIRTHDHWCSRPAHYQL